MALTVRGALLCRAHHTLLENVEAAGPREETASDIALRIYFAHEGERCSTLRAAMPQARKASCRQTRWTTMCALTQRAGC